MKTIEDRAKEYSERDFLVKMSCSLTYKHCVEDAYTKGATEQKKIDYEAVEAFIYDAWGIGDIEGIKDIRRLIDNLKKVIGV